VASSDPYDAPMIMMLNVLAMLSSSGGAWQIVDQPRECDSPRVVYPLRKIQIVCKMPW
jgi:hypothetical protein